MVIYEQLKDYCDCEKVEEKDVDELIGLISMATCWREEPCDTFLNEERQEVIDLPDCMDDCDVFEFAPHYHPFDKDTFSFTLVETKGMDEKSYPITDFVYSEIDEVFRMQFDQIPNCECGCDPCGCETKYRLVVTYMAGYSEIPDCLLPIFCEALHWVEEKNNCDCEDCQPCKERDYLQAQERDLAYGVSLTDRLADFFLKFLTHQYIRELSLISLCESNDYLKGFIV